MGTFGVIFKIFSFPYVLQHFFLSSFFLSVSPPYCLIPCLSPHTWTPSICGFTALLEECDRVQSRNLLRAISLLWFWNPQHCGDKRQFWVRLKMNEEQKRKRTFLYIRKSFSRLGRWRRRADMMKAVKQVESRENLTPCFLGWVPERWQDPWEI